MGSQLKSILAVLLLTALSTYVSLRLPATTNVAAFALDLVPFAGAAVMAAITIIHLKRSGTSLIPLMIAAYSSLAGTLVGALGVAHLVAVIHKALSTAPLTYDFRLYSLIQLGGALVLCGCTAAMLAPRVARGERPAWTISVIIWSVLLLINVPLMPLQGFAVLFTVLAMLGLLAMYYVRG